MKPKHQRLAIILLSMLIMALAATAILYSFRENMIFFYTPTQWQEKSSTNVPSRMVRIGGLVKKGSVKNIEGGGIRFAVTDFKHELKVQYRGLVPSLFREGQGVVAQGSFDTSGVLIAENILAKHDENYMPREVVDALKKSGEWSEGTGRYKVPKAP